MHFNGSGRYNTCKRKLWMKESCGCRRKEDADIKDMIFVAERKSMIDSFIVSRRTLR